MLSTICVVEDRVICEPCLKLLVLSLKMHCPNLPINVYYPPAGERFIKWIETVPQVRLRTERLAIGLGWNVKPHAILQLLDEGFEEVVWIDSDIILHDEMSPTFSNLNTDILVATEHTLSEERSDPDALRARLWGLPVGRVLPYGLSSGVVRATRSHYRLMAAWRKLLQSSEYLDSQQKPWNQRPVHMLGDQDVLTALLTSKEFSNIPLKILRRGKDIIQFTGVYGYTVAERLRNLLGDGPVFIHSGAGKPWSEQWPLKPEGLREYIKEVYLDLSPYTLSALRFRGELGCLEDWMSPHYKFSKLLRVLGIGSLGLSGLPIAAVTEFGRLAKWLKGRMTRSHAHYGVVRVSD